MIQHWYDEYPAVYRAELDTLQNGLPFFSFAGQVPFVNTNKQLIVYGYLEYKPDEKKLIQISFPYGYPFAPPKVFPCKEIKNHLGIDIPIPEILSGRAQYSDGSMCLFKDAEVWQPFRNYVALALKQAILWLAAATSPAGITEDLTVPENNPIIPPTGQVIYYFNGPITDSLQGALFLKSFKLNCYSLLQIHCDIGDEVNVTKCFPDGTALSNIKDDYVFGSWYRINRFSAKDTLPQIVQGEQFKGFLSQHLGINVDSLLPNPTLEVKRVIIGLYFSQDNQLHFFELSYWKEGLQTKFRPSYLLPKNLSLELFSRVDSLYNLETLSQKKVVIVGVGAIGSEACKELSAAGIGRFTLIDYDFFEAGNTVRHAADLNHIGEHKVNVVKKIIESRNPKAIVDTIPTDIFNLSVNDITVLFEEGCMVLDCTANQLVEKYLSKICTQRGLTLVLAAVSRGGLTGNVLAVVPGESACLDCLTKQQLNQVPASLHNIANLEDTMPDNTICSSPAMPGSGIDTREVALQAARVSLQLIFRNEGNIFYPKMRGYQYYWYGPAGGQLGENAAIREPFTWEIMSERCLEPCVNNNL